jgi:SAM-dependent methyltransferase
MSRKDAASVNGSGANVKDYKRDFWREENLKFVKPHFRLEKAARIINRIAQGRERDLLDVGCGPATLQHYLDRNIHYHGVDIAIHDPAPNMMETDFLENPIKFGEKQFDIVIAQGFFEYVGTVQSQKFAEIRDLLAKDGVFVVSYWNFGHRKTNIASYVSNIQPLDGFRKSLASYFNIDGFSPASHNWKHGMPSRKLIKALNMHVNVNVPLISPKLAVEYFFICSARASVRV